ncbi:MAG TPA: hypothetical protein VJZ27_02340 [Aggregatilineales bacterium]|nr:hypothetical protein [Aggregatilineales bacterium]
MRYFVKARLKPGKKHALLKAIENRTLGLGSIAGGEYIRDMKHARQLEDETICWIEVCYCSIPLMEERPYWEEYFELVTVKNAHARDRCKDINGTDPWACSTCDCTERLENTIRTWGDLFITNLRENRLE